MSEMNFNAAADSLQQEYYFLYQLATAQAESTMQSWRKGKSTPSKVKSTDPSFYFASDLAGDGPYERFVEKHSLTLDERILLLTAMIPTVCPLFFNSALGGEGNMVLAEFPGICLYHMQRIGVSLPTGLTALFILGQVDFGKRMGLLELMENDAKLFKEGILKWETVEPHGPPYWGVLKPTEATLSEILRGKPYRPSYSQEFPAKELRTSISWDGIVLETETAQRLRDLIQWIEYETLIRTRWDIERAVAPGVRALFHGPPGTGKTLAANLLGKELGKPVYRIDLSMIVSKYIGETEKNLEGVFQQAENKDWILFFDEADALFGKRTSVQDAHDRYANQEVSYLLQRIEGFQGTVVLATNRMENMDEAFLRRFQDIIHFPVPKASQRRELWARLLPAEAYDHLSKEINTMAKEYAMAGGAMVNVVRYICLKAQIKGGFEEVTKDDILTAVRYELSKEGRLL